MALYNVLFDIAAKTASFESSMTRVEKRFDSMISVAKKASIALGGIFTIEKISSAISSAIQYAGEIDKIAQKAGISAKAASELAFAFQQNELEVQSVTASLRAMQVNLAKGDDSFRQLGLSIDSLKTQSADKQFAIIAQRISEIVDPADRARAAVEIFGKAGADLLPIINQGADGIQRWRDRAVELGRSMDDEMVARLQEADEAMKQMKASAESMAQTFAVVLSPTIKQVADGLRTLAGGATELEKLETKLDFLTRERNSILPFILNLGYDEGGGVVMGPGAIDKRIQEIQARIEELKNAAAGSSSSVPTETAFVGFSRDEAIDQAQSASDELRDLMDRNMSDIARDFDAILNNGVTLVQEYVANIDEGLRATPELMDQLSADIAEAAADTQEQLEQSNKEWSERVASQFGSMSEYAREAARNMQDYFSEFLFDPFSEGLSGMLSGFIDVIRRMVANAAAAKLAEALFGNSDTGTDGLLSGVLNGLFSGYRASGGSVSAGKSYIVGEQGPELFMPGASGAIAPNAALAGTGSSTINVSYNVDARGATQDAVKLLPQAMEQTHDRTIATILDMKRRGKF